MSRSEKRFFEKKLRKIILKNQYAKVDTIEFFPFSVIDKFVKKINWNKVSSSYNLSEKFIYEYSSFVDWDELIINEKQFLSEELIINFKNNIDSQLLFQYRIFSEKFLRNNINFVNWFFLQENPNQKLSDSFVEEYFEFFDCGKEINFSEKIKEKFFSFIELCKRIKKEEMKPGYVYGNYIPGYLAEDIHISDFTPNERLISRYSVNIDIGNYLVISSRSF